MSIRRPELANAAALNAPYLGPRAEDTDASAFNLNEFVAVLRARWMIIALAVLACLSLGLVVILATPRAYTATVSILLDVTPRAPPGSDAAAPQGTPDATLIDTQVRLFASDAVLRRVAQQENLGEDSEFASTVPGLRARLLAMVGIGPSQGPDGARDRVSQATGALFRAVTVKRSEKTYVVDVDVTSRDPEKAARLANAIAGAYLADQRAARMQLNRRDTAWLNQRITELQTRLREAENRAQDFRAQNNLVDANGKNLIEQELADASSEVAKARARVVETKARADMIRTATAAGRASEVGDVLRYGVLDRLRSQLSDLSRQEANLRTTLGERHPALREIENQIVRTRQQMTLEMKRVGELAQADYQMAQKASVEAEKRMDLARETTQRNNQLLVQLRDLERDVDASRDVYQKFLRSRESTSDDGGGDGTSARVIAPAQTPVSPSAPKSMVILFVSLAAGLFFGSGGAVATDVLAKPRRPDGQRREEDQAWPGETDPNIPIVATLPRVSGWRLILAQFKDFMLRSRVDGLRSCSILLREADNRPGTAYAAAVRQLYEAVQTRPARRGQRSSCVVLVAALEPGAGTSVTASNLAFVAAKAGRSVLLIDGNSDRPSLAALVPAGAQANLINLQGTYRPIYRVQGQSAPLDLVPMMPDEEELCFRIAQQRAYEPIEGMNGRYDFVVIDGPVLNGGDEDRELAAVADRVLLVVPDASKSRVSVDDLIYDLDINKAKFAGVVVTFPGRSAP